MANALIEKSGLVPMKNFRILACTPPAAVDPAIAIAACRTGELGVLDLQFCSDFQPAHAAIEKLSHFSRGPCGIKLEGRSPEFIERMTGRLPDPVQVAVLTSPDPVLLREIVSRLHASNLQVLIEAKTLGEAVVAQDADADGVIAKGNESGGFVGHETTFVLLQRLLQQISLPVLAQGGIGLRTAPACRIAGAAGVVLDAQLLLAKESSLSKSAKIRISRMDGSETRCFGLELDAPVRLYHSPAVESNDALEKFEKKLLGSSESSDTSKKVEWYRFIRKSAGLSAPDRQLMPIGQDAAFASRLAERFVTTGGIVKAFDESIERHLKIGRRRTPFSEESPMARSHGTQYPIVQGPMTRVSDRAGFLSKVAEAGGLPFLALGFCDDTELLPVFEESVRRLGARPWGVGMIGFVPARIQKQQMALIDQFRPSYALIAGGQPEQAKEMEDKGISTYLHVPSPGLLKMFIQKGVRRFIFEGRECGGHIGPRSSFIIWNDAIDIILDETPQTDLPDLHVLFAGGIHDALSSAMVAALAAPLAELDVKVGILMGTAYLFTEEALSTGAILERYQQEAIRCDRTW
jgi:NAD(P)H-dependent flavin oxidoreductase YrpB (nitropropane dioxygenase family)